MLSPTQNAFTLIEMIEALLRAQSTMSAKRIGNAIQFPDETIEAALKIMVDKEIVQKQTHGYELLGE